jgi:hypothetical protein
LACAAAACCAASPLCAATIPGVAVRSATAQQITDSSGENFMDAPQEFARTAKYRLAAVPSSEPKIERELLQKNLNWSGARTMLRRNQRQAGVCRAGFEG